MDAAKALSALQSGDMMALVDSLDWDQRDTIVLPDGSTIQAFRKGNTMAKVTDGELTLRGHDHDTDEEARACYDAIVQEARETVDQFVAFAQKAMAQMAMAGASLSAPDDATGLLSDI